MSIYNETEDGGFYLDGRSIPNSEGNKDYQKMRKEVDNGNSSLISYTTPQDLRSYRDLRQERYTAELSPEGNFEKTVGDILDAIIKAQYGDSSELDALALQISQIKTDIPST
jgi:hypothetical protein